MEQNLESKVFQIADRLHHSGHKVSVRVVMAEAGGSLATVAKYLRSWRANKQAISGEPPAVTVSINLIQALQDEVEKKMREAKKGWVNRISELEASNVELEEIVGKLESGSATLKTDNEKLQKEILDLRPLTEKHSSLKAKIQQQQETITKLKSDLAVSESKYNERERFFGEQQQRLQSEIESWQKRYDDSKKELQVAIERAVKAESHLSSSKK